MVSCTFTKDELGNNIANYSNGFTLTESYDTDSTPINGIIKDEKSNLVYKREIKCDIYKYIKHILAILCLLLRFSAKAYDFQSGGIYYNITSKTEVEVITSNQSYLSEKYTGEIIIPEIVTSPYRKKSYKVTSISSNAFSDCPGSTSVTMPNSVRSIGSLAFHNCKDLTSVTISNSVTSIGNLAFQKCTKLTSIIIPNAVTNIGEGAFQDCIGLTSVVIGKGLTDIGNSTFYGCKELKEIYCSATTPPPFHESCFHKVPKDVCKL